MFESCRFWYHVEGESLWSRKQTDCPIVTSPFAWVQLEACSTPQGFAYSWFPVPLYFLVLHRGSYLRFYFADISPVALASLFLFVSFCSSELFSAACVSISKCVCSSLHFTASSSRTYSSGCGSFSSEPCTHGTLISPLQTLLMNMCRRFALSTHVVCSSTSASEAMKSSAE